MIRRREKLLGSAYRLFYRNPVHIIRGDGVWLFDASGRRYLDMYNNVAHVGHCNAQVVAAVADQMATLNTHTRYLHDNILDYAERLTAKLATELDIAMFACSGSEANELALRVASAATGGSGLIVTSFAYHGTSRATYEISTSDIAPDVMPNHVVTVPVPDLYRGEHRDPAGAGELYAAYVQAAIDTLRDRGIKPAAFVIDTIVSSGGVVAPPKNYLRKVAQIIRAAGGLFVADEVQPGFGRTGKQFWGYEADEVVPDIVTMGKPMGNGHPLSAMVTRSEIAAEFAAQGRYFNTFGGNPVSCAAGLAVLDVLEQDDLQNNALRVGQYLVDGLRHLSGRHEAIGDVRGTGLFIGVDLVTDRESRTPATALAANVINGLRERGVLTGTIGPQANVLKLRSPLVLSEDHVDLLLNALDTTLAECSERPTPGASGMQVS
jgi:4-aminobutyrate aminotransferase-like enzyme